jgi:amidohydrolase
MSAEMIAFRRVLHSQPELSGAEHLTTEMLAERLIVEGFAPQILKTGTGLVCDLPLMADLPVGTPMVALRADIDALAMDDLKDVPYRSQNPGVAHACGHDVHTAAVLGAALRLLERGEDVPGIVRLIFEPSEETAPGGAVDVIGEGWLQGVQAIFGVHCDPRLDVGTVGIREGSLTSASDHFEIELRGPGGHTARPEQTVDLVRLAGQIAAEISDTVRAQQPEATVVLGTVHSGAAPNVIPSRALLTGTFRTPDIDVWHNGRAILTAALLQILPNLDGFEWELVYTVGVPPVVNDPVTTAFVRTVLPMTSVQSVPTEQSRGGDSFAWYQKHVPGTYIRLGTHNPASNSPRQDLHSASFDVDERAIGIGSEMLSALALTWLTQRAKR